MKAASHPSLADLNAQQREAVFALEKPVLVVAGPGTGKTRTLTARLAYLLEAHGVSPSSLLAVTFTTRAARDMGLRLAQLAGETARGVCLGTFHSLCLHLLRREGPRLDLPGDFGVCDRQDQVAILQTTLRQQGRQHSPATAQQLLQTLSHSRNQSINPQPSLVAQGLHEIYEAYQAHLRTRGLLDFDDLLSLAMHLLDSFPELRQRLQEQYTYVSVDEYQDVNPLQHRLLQLLVSDRANLWAVGDADQAIYAFRGAEVAHVLRFEQDFPGSRIIRLETSYRLTPQIATAATQVIAQNSCRLPFTVRTDNPDGPRIHVASLQDEQAEAAWVVRMIEDYVGGTSHYQHDKGGVPDTARQRQKSFRDFAVLFRLHALARPLEEAFARSGIPYQVVGSIRLFDRKAARDLLAYLRVIGEPGDDASLRRVLNSPPRGIGPQTQAALETEAERRGVSLAQVMEQAPPIAASQGRAVKDLLRLLQRLRQSLSEQTFSRWVRDVLETTGLQRWRIEQDPRTENDFLMIRGLAAKYDEQATPAALHGFLTEAAMTVESDEYDATADRVTLMTLHAAKGLEFSDVVVCGMEESILPCRDADLEEERRLFYVGLTRARERVHLLHCRQRFLFGERLAGTPSRFLAEFDESLMERSVAPDRPSRAKDSQDATQLSLL